MYLKFEKGKKNCLIVLKRKSNYCNSLIRNFSNFYNVDMFFVHEMLNKNSNEIIAKINKIIENQNTELVLFEGDYISLINNNFIKSINCKFKCLLTLDDDDCHDFNFITAKACDLVLSVCPISVQKYLKKGLNAHFFTLESSSKIFKDHKLEKDIDVLFFGRKSIERKNYISFIKDNNVKIKIIGWDGPYSISDEELSKIISRSKIVVNFTGTSNKYKKHNQKTLDGNQKQLKGRIWQAGLCKAACVSENFPAKDIIFNDEQIAIFNNKEECVKLIHAILEDEKLLKKYTDNLNNLVMAKYETKKNLYDVNNYIMKLSREKKPYEKEIPFWYSRFVNKKRIITYFRNKYFMVFLSEYFQIIRQESKKLSLLYLLNFLEASIYLLIYAIKFPFLKIKK